MEPSDVTSTSTSKLTSTPTPPQISPTDSPHSPSAATRTIHLPEILEQILTNLPQRDLLLAQRVSRAFQSTIAASPKLQRALFFAPDPHLPLSPVTYLNPATGATSVHARPRNNSLLLRAFPGVYPTVSPVLVNLPPSRDDLLVGRPGPEVWSWDVCISFPAAAAAAAAAVAASKASGSGSGESSSNEHDKPSDSDSTHDNLLLPPSTSAATSRPNASWRRMYLSQPPCTALHLVRRWRRSRSPAIQRARGITMGDFVSEATRGGGGGGGGGGAWSEGFVGSDRDWHFEGSVGGGGEEWAVG